MLTRVIHRVRVQNGKTSSLTAGSTPEMLLCQPCLQMLMQLLQQQSRMVVLQVHKVLLQVVQRELQQLQFGCHPEMPLLTIQRVSNYGCNYVVDGRLDQSYQSSVVLSCSDRS